MNAQVQNSVLRQMAQARQPASPDVPLTASRAVRLAMTRAAQNVIGLKLSIQSVGEDTLSLDELLEVLTDELLMVALKRGDAVGGLMACDFQFLAAVAEIQTLGQVGATVPEPRKVTGTDMALSESILQGVIAELMITTPRTSLDSWVDDYHLGHRFDEVRRIPFDLPDVVYRLVRIAVDPGIEGREGVVLMALPLQVQTVKRPTETIVDWETHFRAAVLKAPASLDAVLHQFDMPLHVATGLEVGQVIPLPGCSVGSVQLVAPDGKPVARARLGQIAGRIAVRLQNSDDTPLTDMPGVHGESKSFAGDMGGGLDLGGPDMLAGPAELPDNPDGMMPAAPMMDLGGDSDAEMPMMGAPMSLDPAMPLSDD